MYKQNRLYGYLVLVVILLTAMNFFDFVLQAYQHGWATPWALDATGSKYIFKLFRWDAGFNFDLVIGVRSGWFVLDIDGIAFWKDSWHTAQFLRNLFTIIGYMLFGYIAYQDLVMRIANMIRHFIRIAYYGIGYAILTILVVIAVNAISRGIGFSLFYKLYNVWG